MEEELVELCKLLESQNALWEIHGLPGFHKALVRDLWIRFGAANVRAAIIATGMNGWKPRMIEKILTGEANPDPKPAWKKQTTPALHKPAGQGRVGSIADIDLSGASIELRKSIEEIKKKLLCDTGE